MTDPTAQIIVVTHGALACALQDTVELIAGPQDDLLCLGLLPGEDLEILKAQLGAATASGKPTLILVDMLGGTPWNVALVLAAQCPSVRVVSGVNLPMLLEVALSRSGADVDQLARVAQETGAQAVQIGIVVHQ